MVGTVTATGAVDRSTLARLVGAYTARRPGWQRAPGAAPVVLDVADLVAGRPGVIDVVAAVGDAQVHVVLGLRAPGDEARFFPGMADPVLGLCEDAHGLAVAFDATADEQTSTALLEAVAGMPSSVSWAHRLQPASTSVTVAFDDRIGLTVLDRLTERGARWMTLLQSLDDAGFNHLPGPVAFWRRGPYHLGMVREILPAATSGWAMALGSLRDLLASGGAPEHAGGDFAGEAERLGTMAARLHLALERVYGRRPGNVAAWSASVASAVRAGAPHLAERDDVRRVLDDLVTLPVPCLAIETHGDLHLGRVARTDQGWYLVDGPDGDHAWPGTGAPAGTFRSPLADVADMLWSLGHVAAVAVAESGPSAGSEGAVGADAGVPDATAARRTARQLADAWERRNRRAFIGGYLAVPGIGGLVPPVRHALRTVTAAFELEQSVRRARPPAG